MTAIINTKRAIGEIAATIPSLPTGPPDTEFAALVLELTLQLVAEMSPDVRNDEALNTAGTLVIAVQRYIAERTAAETVAARQETILAAIASDLEKFVGVGC